LREQMGLAASSDDPDPHQRQQGSDAETGPAGRRPASTTRGSFVRSSTPYVPPPAQGTRPARNPGPPHSFDVHEEFSEHSRGRVPRADFPKFDGKNPRLWQTFCEDYFELYETSPHLWVKLASIHFIGPASRWLNSIQSTIHKYTWSEFCQEVLIRFGRNQHQSLI
jgi:hypothetical protein